jgi:hypothetical protein
VIKIALKHFIYDHCVNVFFDKITDNFIRPKVKQWIQSTWTIELSNDFTSSFGGDHYSELVQRLTRECEKEIDAEIFKVMAQWNDLVKRTHNPVIVTTFSNSTLPPLRKRQ